MSAARNERAAEADRERDGWLLRLLSEGSRLSRSRRLLLYAGVALAALALVWVPVGVFVILTPASYTSTWALILPGSGAGHAVSLESVGQASATMSSPYASRTVDPKVNYKALAQSDPVLAAAASALGLSVEAFGEPRVKLVDQTALMYFRVSAPSPPEAHARSIALYEALQAELERLRNDELDRREAGINDMLRGFSEKLRDAQNRILEFQSQAQIVSLEQFTELTMSLERMRNRLRDLRAARAGLDGQLEALRDALGVAPSDASALLELQRDALFRTLVEQWAEASALLTRNQARFGRKHQHVVSARQDESHLRRALTRRARTLVPDGSVEITRLTARGSSEPALYRNLVELHAREVGMNAEIASLEQSVVEQEARIERGTTDASNLEDLTRRHQVATAVFTTALAKADIGKSDRFSSYPLVQLLAEPTIPDRPDTLARNLALLGAAGGSLLSLLGLVLLWIRKPFFQRTLKNA